MNAKKRYCQCSDVVRLSPIRTYRAYESLSKATYKLFTHKVFWIYSKTISDGTDRHFREAGFWTADGSGAELADFK